MIIIIMIIIIIIILIITIIIIIIIILIIIIIIITIILILIMPVLTYPIWTQHWPITELRVIDREARKMICENGGKHPLCSTAIMCKRERRAWLALG